MLKKILRNADEIILMIFLAAMCIVLALQVFFRYVLNTPLIWSEEVARYLFVWITFIGAGYGVRKHLHIEMTFLFIKLPKQAQKVIQIIINIIAIIAFAYIIPESIKFMKSQHILSATTFSMPLSVLFSAVPIGIAILIIRIIQDTYYIIVGKIPDGGDC